MTAHGPRQRGRLADALTRLLVSRLRIETLGKCGLVERDAQVRGEEAVQPQEQHPVRADEDPLARAQAAARIANEGCDTVRDEQEDAPLPGRRAHDRER